MERSVGLHKGEKKMIGKVTHIPLLVRDQQEALDWYTEKLGFVLKSDDPFPDNPDARWITIAPPDQQEIEIILQPPEWGTTCDVEERAAMIGKMPGFVLVTDDMEEAYEELTAKGVTFVDDPMEMPWGKSALFADLYGHVHNLLEPRVG
jgi:catechol 2,3-dioxygenase-like lactoylglutathione lyase family enzyme